MRDLHRKKERVKALGSLFPLQERLQKDKASQHLFWFLSGIMDKHSLCSQKREEIQQSASRR